MSFRKLEQQPRGYAIAKPSAAADIGAIKVPPLSLFTNEDTFWQTMFWETNQAHDTLARHAEGIAQGLRDSAGSILTARLFIENIDLTSPLERENVAKWHSMSITRVAYSRMLREMLPRLENVDLNLAFSAADVKLGFDLDPTDYVHGGVHFKDHLLRQGLDIEPPGSQGSEWYEGESVYLRVSAPPAQPTDDFAEKFEEFYGTPFSPEDYFSVVPRLKAEAW